MSEQATPADPTLISRHGERDGSLRVEAHIYGVDIRIFGAPTFGLTMPQARVLLERLQQAIEDVEAVDETTYNAGDAKADAPDYDNPILRRNAVATSSDGAARDGERDDD